jgi:hypothetical protein
MSRLTIREDSALGKGSEKFIRCVQAEVSVMIACWPVGMVRQGQSKVPLPKLCSSEGLLGIHFQDLASLVIVQVTTTFPDTVDMLPGICEFWVLMLPYVSIGCPHS